MYRTCKRLKDRRQIAHNEEDMRMKWNNHHVSDIKMAYIGGDQGMGVETDGGFGPGACAGRDGLAL